MKNIISIFILTASMILSGSVCAAKLTVAIGSIEYRAKDTTENKQYRAYGKGSREDTRAFVDMLTTALVKTRKFNVIERDRMAEILKEQGLSMAGIVDGTSENLKLKGVDYILTGAITEYGESATGMKIKGFSTASTSAAMSVDIRVLDAKNGQIMTAETIRTVVKGATALKADKFSTGSSTSSGTLLSKVMRNSATNITNLMVSTIYPIKIVSVTKKGLVLLNYGNGLLTEGDQLEIFSRGEPIFDPDTGEELGSEEELIGRVSVISAQAKFSKSTIMEGEGAIEKGMLARIVKPKPQKTKKLMNKLNPW